MTYRLIGDSCTDLDDNLKKDDKIVIVPLTLEIGDYSVKDDDKFNAIKKINGFLGCATYVSSNKYMGKSFNNKVLYSTTGTLDSDYAVMVENHLSKYEELFRTYPNHTFLFEIVDVSDPHIIEEVEGEYLLACRDVESGKLINQNHMTCGTYRQPFSYTLYNTNNYDFEYLQYIHTNPFHIYLLNILYLPINRRYIIFYQKFICF